MSNTDPRADAKLQNLPESALEDLWRFRHPEEGGEKLTYDAILVEIPRLHGFSVALSTLHSFYRWLELKRRMDARASAAEQLKLELARNPENSEEKIQQAGQRLFLTEGIVDQNFKQFAGAVKMSTDAAKLKQAEEKLKIQKQSLRLDERRVALLEQKAAQADAAKDVLATSLTPEEQNRRLREILK